MPGLEVHFLVTSPMDPPRKLYELSDEISAVWEVGDSFGQWVPSGSLAWG